MVLSACHVLQINFMIQNINLVVPALEVKLQMHKEFVNALQIPFGLVLNVLNVTILNTLILILRSV